MNKTKIRATEQPIAVDIEGLTRIENEIARLDSMVLNA